ncbi:MAG: GNAT family N-acetyltransferase [Candidatus Eisenbacteria bacterium]|nr:GNAT family N-acetyltransferase [Candidatus Eisenbacteria bacterium]
MDRQQESNAQPVGRGSLVSLREITTDNLRAVCKLAVAPHQAHLVAGNAFSIAEASFHATAWYRAIYADETPVGFAMLNLDVAKPEYYLWRFMLDARYQRMGFGRQAIALLVEQVRRQPAATELLLSYVPGVEEPAPFYASLGFLETGTIEDGERIMKLPLALEPHPAVTAGPPRANPPPIGAPFRPATHALWSGEKMGKSSLYQSAHLLLGLNALEPGQEHALHAHSGMDKVYYVLFGEGRFLLEGRELPMRAGDMLIAPDGLPHGIRNDGSGRLLALALLAPGPRS